MVKIAIIGAGVNGMGCACRIIEKFPKFKVTVIAKSFTPDTTGDGSAGFWEPYLSPNTPPQKLMQWGAETYNYIHSLWLQGFGGVCLIPSITLSRGQEPFELPEWTKATFGARLLSKKKLRFLSDQHSAQYTGGMSFITFTCEPISLLPMLMEKFKMAGGEITQREVKALYEIIQLDFDIIINCSGLGARDIVPDRTVYPIRGQVSRVKAPWMFHCTLDLSCGNYVIPNVDSVVLGGTSQKDNYNTEIDPKDAEHIHRGCEMINPGLKNALLLKEWAGLRPGRDSVRLEREDLWTKSRTTTRKRKVVVIHNYGHGGCGVTLFWGCAKEVVDLVEDALKDESLALAEPVQSHL